MHDSPAPPAGTAAGGAGAGAGAGASAPELGAAEFGECAAACRTITGPSIKGSV